MKFLIMHECLSLGICYFPSLWSKYSSQHHSQISSIYEKGDPTAFWDVTLCVLGQIYRRFKGTYWLQV
jgi:hypothetical protein